MSKQSIIPAEVKFAAKRGFVRTAYQSLATSAAGGAGLTFVFTQDAILAALVGVGFALLTATLNGLQSYFSIVSRGIPDEYAVEQELTVTGRYAAIEE